MTSKNYLGMGVLLVLMGVAGLHGTLDVPTWLGVWNLAMGAITVLYGASRWLKGE